MRGFLATMATLLLVSGCGGSEDRASSPEPVQTAQSTSTPGAANVADTEGRLGDATFSRRGERKDVVPGGKLDPKPKPRRGGASGVSGSGACDGAQLQPSAETLQQAIGATLCLVNSERAASGLAPLRTNDLLTKAAQAHGASMVAEGYFSHTGSDGSDPQERAAKTGYTKGQWLVGENLAWGSGPLAEPKAIVVGWMNSQGHRENIMRSAFEEVGVAVVPGNPRSKDGSGGTYVTVFGKASGGAPEPEQTPEQPAEPTATGTPGGNPPPSIRKCRNLRGKRRARCRRAARR